MDEFGQGSSGGARLPFAPNAKWTLCWELLFLIAEALYHDGLSGYEVSSSILKGFAPTSIRTQRLAQYAYAPSHRYASLRYHVLDREDSERFPHAVIENATVLGSVYAVVYAASVFEDRARSGRATLELTTHVQYTDPVLEIDGRSAFHKTSILEANFWIYSCKFPNGVLSPGYAYSRATFKGFSEPTGEQVEARYKLRDHSRTLDPEANRRENSVNGIHIRCPIPRNMVLARDGTDHSEIKVELLVTTPRGPAADVPVRVAISKIQQEERRNVTVCSQPMYNADDMEEKHPGVIRTWLWYHLEFLKVDRFQIYDLDSSFGKYFGEFSDRVDYVPNWSSRFIREDIFPSECWYCTEFVAYDHCIFTNRGVSEWVLRLHSTDEYLAPPPSLAQAYLESVQDTTRAQTDADMITVSHLISTMQSQHPTTGALYLNRVNFGVGFEGECCAVPNFGANKSHPGVFSTNESFLLAHTYRSDDWFRDYPTYICRPTATEFATNHQAITHFYDAQSLETDVESEWHAVHFQDVYGVRCNMLDNPVSICRTHTNEMRFVKRRLDEWRYR